MTIEFSDVLGAIDQGDFDDRNLETLILHINKRLRDTDSKVQVKFRDISRALVSVGNTPEEINEWLQRLIDFFNSDLGYYPGQSISRLGVELHMKLVRIKERGDTELSIDRALFLETVRLLLDKVFKVDSIHLPTDLHFS